MEYVRKKPEGEVEVGFHASSASDTRLMYVYLPSRRVRRYRVCVQETEEVWFASELEKLLQEVYNEGRASRQQELRSMFTTFSAELTKLDGEVKL